jgi:hypothetical protein
MNKKAVVAGVVLACVMLAPVVIAAEGVGSTPSTISGQTSSPQVVGEWQFKSQMQGMSFSATMTITKNAEGKYSGTWSAEWGESTLSDITLEKGAIKFVQTSDFGGQQMKTTYEATVEGGKIKGKGQNQFGESIVEGTLQGEAKTGADAIVGTWELNITVPAREIAEKMTITKNTDGALAGNWVAQRGESTISNIKFEAGKLTFTRKGKMGAMEWESTYEGTVEGDQIKGAFRSDWGEMQANATRIIAPKPDEGKKADANAPGAGKAEPNKPAAEKPK